MYNPGDYVTFSFCDERTSCPDCSKDKFITPRSDWPGADYMDSMICGICAQIHNIDSSNDEHEVEINNDDIDIEEDDNSEDNDNDSENEVID